MNLGEYSIAKSVVIWMMIILIVGGGFYAYEHLGRLEDPEFTIKEAVVITPYPGATPQEVEEEVTDEVERAAQQLSYIKRIESTSRPGHSEVNVVIQDRYNRHDLPQIWDELRRKINDMQKKLPKGAGPSIVNDDFGDVYGMYFALTGEGYSYKELHETMKQIEKQLLLVPGVAKVTTAGNLPEQIFIEISQARIASLGISLQDIYATLRAQNLVSESGQVQVGDEYIRITPSGYINSVKAIGNILIVSPKSKKQLYLDDIATIKRGYQEVPDKLVFYDGKPAITFGVSVVSDGNVVKVGQAVRKRLRYLFQDFPLGLDVHAIYEQPKLVEQSVSGFVINVLEAFAIVIVVLLFTMGLQSGIIIGVILLLTVLGTLAFMYFFAIPLQRISLGALIIALGMMVDNAIVVVEGILVRVQGGQDTLSASRDVVQSNQWPLLGATIVGILAFAAIGLSQDSTGEYTASLFYVILISLLLSWWLALTAAPLFCNLLLKPGKGSGGGESYDGGLYRYYRGFLQGCLSQRMMTVVISVSLLVLSIFGFGYLKPGFFPDSTTALFMINYWRVQGSDIRATQREMLTLSKDIKKLDGVTNVTSIVGGPALRFTLVYNVEKHNPSYGQFIIGVKDYRDIDKLSRKVVDLISERYPHAEPIADRIRLGTSKGAKIEARLSGPDAKILRQLSLKIQNIFHENVEAIDIRDDWRQRVKIIRPIFSEALARKTGITRHELMDTLQMVYSGKQVSVYREGDELIPIISRAPGTERLDIASMSDVQIWSPLLSRVVPISQVVSRVKYDWQNDIIKRRNRLRTITVSCNPANIPAGTLFEQLRPKVEAIKLPPGFYMEWGGEFESSRDAQTALAKQLPGGFLSMIVIVVLLFGTVKQPLIIWLSVPLAVIGVVTGLMITNNAFEFMALLGFLSLTGMLIKNSVVLIDQIDHEINEGKPAYQAIIHSALSRARPVILAALTTVLGMIPLLQDAFFKAMAVTIIFGLSFATVLTLIIVPVLYAIFFKVKPESPASTQKTTT